MQFETIPTPRLTLRRTDPLVYKYVFDHYSDDALQLFFGVTAEQLHQLKKDVEAGYTTFNKSFCMFQILLAGKNIGWCGYHTIYVPHQRAEIGYVLTDTVDHGKGYMKEVLPIVIRYGFEVMQLHRIEAFVGPTNEASTRLLQANGFSKEGHLKEHYFKNGLFEDSILYGLLRSQFK